MIPLEARALRYFVAVADAGQITMAAHELHVAQPALSQAIQRLEAQVGLALLHRHSRGVRLTAAGEALLARARAVTDAVDDAEATVQALVRAERAAIAWGFIGAPPLVEAPELLAAFTAAHPAAAATFLDLGFPRTSTARWLDPVDVALCWSPTPDPGVEAVVVRSEPRVVLLAAGHRLAGRAELAVQDVLEETFCGYHPSLEPRRVAFWTLDAHRGGPPARRSVDRVTTAQEALAAVATGRGIATAPAASAASLLGGLEGVRAVPLSDGAPAELTLLWRRGPTGELVRSLASLARRLALGRSAAAG